MQAKYLRNTSEGVHFQRKMYSLTGSSFTKNLLFQSYFPKYFGYFFYSKRHFLMAGSVDIVQKESVLNQEASFLLDTLENLSQTYHNLRTNFKTLNWTPGISHKGPIKQGLPFCPTIVVGPLTLAIIVLYNRVSPSVRMFCWNQIISSF